MSVEIDRPSDEVLIAFENGRLSDERAGAVVRWLESAPDADAVYERAVRGRANDWSGLRRPDDHPPSVEEISGATDRIAARLESAAREWPGPGEPRRIREYELLGPLGEGGMGQVFRARHTRLRRNCAIKLLGTRLRDCPSFRGRFEREIAVLGQLDHPNLVRAFDAGTEGDDLFLVMELLEGRDLQSHVQQFGALATGAAAAAIRQAALGLHHAHEHGLIHRDVKPSNLFLTDIGVVKVIDLGLARAESAEVVPNFVGTTARTVLGTPDYMAPEQWAPGQPLDRRIDVYALGATLVYLVLGRPPFESAGEQTPWDYWQAHRHQTPPGVGRTDLDAVVRKCMAKRPAERPPTAADVAELLEPLADDAALAAVVGSRPDPRAGRADQTPRLSGHRPRSSRRTWLLAAAGVSASAAGLWYSAPRNRPKVEPEPPPGPRVIAPSKTLLGHAGEILGVAYSPDGTLLASSGQDGSIILWDAATGKQRSRLSSRTDGVFGVAFSPDGRRLASVSDRPTGWAVQLWDVAAGREETRLGGRNSGLFAVEWAPDGTAVVCGGWDKTVTVWDVATARPRLAMTDAIEGHVRALTVSPDGRSVAAGGRGRTRCWSLDDGTALPVTLPSELCPIFAPKGGEIAGWTFTAGRVTICSWPGGQVRAMWRAHPRKIEGMAYSRDGRYLVTTGDDHDPIGRLWSAADGSLLAELREHPGGGYAAAFAPDGRHVATTGHRDQTVRIWDLAPVFGPRR